MAHLVDRLNLNCKRPSIEWVLRSEKVPASANTKVRKAW